MKLGIIVGTTREGRQSARVSKWVAVAAGQGEEAEVTIIDLTDYPMPFFAEPASPRYNPQRQADPTAQKFLDVLAAQDAYIFVTPEYNHSIPGVLKNALDYIDFQLRRKPAAVVSHSVVPVGGARAQVHLKEILSELFAAPIQNGIALQSTDLSDEGELSKEVKANPYGPQGALEGLVKELKWYGDALAAARAEA
ncbi:MAG TPA: NAD(P)H-dependent oxidoreductase [Candidatus Limnocylindrales bacterium]|nr:NAD(P)H-dependent oxidoreductase [Candidatus Limnocylindrales bacterium]